VGDVNCDFSVDPLDVQYLANFVFLSRDARCDPCLDLPPYIEVTAETSYEITNSVEVHNTNINLSKLVVIIPLPQTNNYQTVSNLTATGATILSIPETDDIYARWINTGLALPRPGENWTIPTTFDITLHEIHAHLEYVTTIYPYNTSADIYQWHTGSSGSYVVPTNPTISGIAALIWNESTDLLDYAERCYDYVADNYSYVSPNTGLHPLSTILSWGGGDCGNLSSIYVSLLRNQGIPARHVVTIRPNTSYHVWADFYLENYGWVPVDVTAKMFDPAGDYFGDYVGDGIVVTKEVELLLEREPGDNYYGALLQNFHWWWWGSWDGNPAIDAYHVVTSVP
jgi:hypothetical protein